MQVLTDETELAGEQEQTTRRSTPVTNVGPALGGATAGVSVQGHVCVRALSGSSARGPKLAAALMAEQRDSRGHGGANRRRGPIIGNAVVRARARECPEVMPYSCKGRESSRHELDVSSMATGTIPPSEHRHKRA